MLRGLSKAAQLVSRLELHTAVASSAWLSDLALLSSCGSRTSGPLQPFSLLRSLHVAIPSSAEQPRRVEEAHPKVTDDQAHKDSDTVHDAYVPPHGGTQGANGVEDDMGILSQPSCDKEDLEKFTLKHRTPEHGSSQAALRFMETIGPLEAPNDELSPDAYDVLLRGMDSTRLHGGVSQFLGVEYLAKAESCEIWPLKGAVYGPQRHCMLAVPVSMEGRAINVHFLLDTRSPYTYLAKEVMDALSVGPDILEGGKNVRINGTLTLLSSSDNGLHHFNGVNLLGMDFLHETYSIVTLNMVSREFWIVRA